MYHAALLSGNFDTSKLRDPREQDRQHNSLAPILSKFGVSHVSQLKPSGSVETYAKATGRTVVYYDPSTDTYITTDGRVVEYDSETMVRQLISKKR